jgi:hypothetical protein
LAFGRRVETRRRSRAVRDGNIPIASVAMRVQEQQASDMNAYFVTERHAMPSDSYLRDSMRSALKSAEVGVRDTAAVDTRNWNSMQYWARSLGISEQQLIRATRVAGTNVALIEAHLAERRARRQRKREASAEL